MPTEQDKVNRADAGAIEVVGLTFAYGRAPVLRDVTFVLEKRAIGLLGPNGSGKTTLLRALLGHLKVTRGSVRVLGSDMAVDASAARRRLGWMPERGGILPAMSGVGMVAYLGELSGMPPTDALQRSHEVLNYVGLADERYRKADTYSQGMRQRLKLAQALVHDPEWLLLDEPTSGLDPSGRVNLLELVRDLARAKGFGVILSTHLLADVRAVCEEILVLRDGVLLDHGRVQVESKGDREAFIVEGFGDEQAFADRLAGAGARVERRERLWEVTLPRASGARRILEAAADCEFALRRLEIKTETLEDLFFRLVDDGAAAAAGKEA
ncbi:ABC transporter ATP-binding protein [bacterium]|nr:ABC transporter ATP-binding protein [bacterium]MBU1676212.1 ABC transporter ATP-binding protein [bacterium]